MDESPAELCDHGPGRPGEHDPNSLQDMQQELRILLPGAQLLTAFLILLPFQGEFAKINRAEKGVYLVTFLCSIASLVLFNAPAAQHRVERPLRDPAHFKQRVNRLVVAGMASLSVALILATDLVVHEIIGGLSAIIVTAIVALLIGVTWWLQPLIRDARRP